MALVVAQLGPGYPAAAATATAWRIERGEVRITVPMKPGGAFEAKTSSLSGTLTLGTGRPLPLHGRLRVDLATIDTGIGLRNRHLRENYLEVSKGPGFEEAVLSDLVLEAAGGADFQGKTRFAGTLLLHGVEHRVEGEAEIRPAGLAMAIRARFRLNLTDFGIEPPEYLGVGVTDRLLVNVVFNATADEGQGE